jgi:hypothetical protein
MNLDGATVLASDLLELVNRQRWRSWCSPGDPRKSQMPGQDPSGDPIYYTFVYWYERAPADISEVLNAYKERVFHFLGASARTDCPASNLAAHAARLAIMETHPWHEAIVAPSTAAEILEASKEQRAQKSLTREQETLDRQCVAYADRLRKTKEKAAASVGAARSYEKMQVTYAEKCGGVP